MKRLLLLAVLLTFITILPACAKKKDDVKMNKRTSSETAENQKGLDDLFNTEFDKIRVYSEGKEKESDSSTDIKTIREDIKSIDTSREYTEKYQGGMDLELLNGDDSVKINISGPEDAAEVSISHGNTALSGILPKEHYKEIEKIYMNLIKK